jgi:hypothetical protein
VRRNGGILRRSSVHDDFTGSHAMRCAVLYRLVLCAALLTLELAARPAAAADRETCANAFEGQKAVDACSRLLKRSGLGPLLWR